MILDHEKGVELPDDIPEKHSNEFRSLRNLVEGLCYLSAQVRTAEAIVNSNIARGALIQAFPPGPQDGFEKGMTVRDVKFQCMGNSPIFRGVSQGLLSCLFHWYSVSACNLVRLIGWLHAEHISDFPMERDYAWEVIPDLMWFRDKVGAHFAKAARNEKDSRADRELSILWQLSFVDGVFLASGLTLTLGGSKGKSSSTFPPWSVTRTHDKLAWRYAYPFAERGEFRGDVQV